MKSAKAVPRGVGSLLEALSWNGVNWYHPYKQSIERTRALQDRYRADNFDRIHGEQLSWFFQVPSSAAVDRKATLNWE